jgi:putative colanic acid biosynthesis acetyltransferase WcaF
MSRLNRFRTIIDSLEFLFIKINKKIYGISFVVRYLRNPNPRISVRVLKYYGAQIGTNTTIKGSLFLDNVDQDKDSAGDFSHLNIGINCYIGDAVSLDLANQVILHDNVVISGRVSILTHSDVNRSMKLSKRFPRKCQKVEIFEDVWIGYGTTILCGVKVSEVCVVASNSLINKDLSSFSVYGGSPVVKIKGL